MRLLLISMLPFLIPFGYSSHDEGSGDGKKQDWELIKINSAEDDGYLMNTAVMCFGGYVPNKEIRFRGRLENPFQEALEIGSENIEEKQEENE